MRLLWLGDDGTISMSEFFGQGIPSYAILSHTWGEEEVLFRDVMEGQYKSKLGYKKIYFCARQALQDGLMYIWVDTCCIDKTSSAELSEAINSMFDWYRNSKKCYVYMSDVKNLHTDDLRKSRWFMRSWTLQELVAPKFVEFFSSEGERIGDKMSLASEIHLITRIPIEALEGAPLSTFRIEDRLEWAKKRESTRMEDRAYSIMGIFGVHMPLIYGEGGDHAFRRLEKEIYSSDILDFHNGGETKAHNISGTPRTVINMTKDAAQDPESDEESDVASIFSDSGSTISSASTASIGPVQTVGIREVSQALLSKESLKTLYTMAVTNIERRKARLHLRGFIRNLGQNLSKEASDGVLEVQAAKFIHELAGRIADEISWNIVGFGSQGISRPPRTVSNKGYLENWLSAQQPQDIGPLVPKPGVDAILQDDESDDELGEDLPFPSIDKVKNFILASEALRIHIIEMQNWLKPSGSDQKGKENMPVESPSHSQPETMQEPEAIHRSQPNRKQLLEMLASVLEFWGVSFWFYDVIDIFLPCVARGHKRLRWRCSCNAILWGDFPAENDETFNQLKLELFRMSDPLPRRVHPDNIVMAQPNIDPGTSSPGPFQAQRSHSTTPRSGPSGVPSRNPNLRNPASISNGSRPAADHVVGINFPPGFFEVCVSTSNHTIIHHEVDISRVTSDSELFELIWDRYNSSRGMGLRRIFLRPREVNFVMFSVSRYNQYGAGIHKKPDEFPPQKELDEKRYHYFHPQIRMPTNVFLHYLHRARWNIWGEHMENTWLRRLPKKLNQSLLVEAQQYNTTSPPNAGAAAMDADLTFGWGVHILDGPNHAALGLLLAVAVAIIFVVSGLIVGFAKTQEQGFGVGNFLLTIIASIMAAIYFQLQDQ